jgi:uncharacterized membrane protein
MSFESAKKLGLTASLINVILPIAMVIIYAGYIFFLFSTLASGFYSSGLSGVSTFSIGFSIALFALGALGFAGFILFLIAMHRLSEYYREPAIFRNVLIAYILQIVAVIVAFAVLLVAIFLSASSAQASLMPSFSSLILEFIGALGAYYVISIVSGVLFMRAQNKLAEKSGVDNFKTFGLIYLIGILLAPALVGGLLVWVAWIIGATGFQKLKPTSATVNQPLYNPPFTAVPNTPKRFCPYCGTENPQDALYCRNCGKQLQQT